MAELADGRVYKRKRIKDPTDQNNYVDIPLMYEARFKMAADQAQEFYVYFDNSANSSREVHVQRITNPQDSSQYVDAERIDEWNIKIMADQAQDITFVITNTDPPPMQPDGSNNPSHEQTHVVRYYKNNNSDSDTWVDVELIDELKIKCMAEQAQEYIWYMKHPELGDPVNDPDISYSATVGYCDSSFEFDESTSPYRLDPFRNIVNVNWVGEEPSDCQFDGNYAGFGPITTLYPETIDGVEYWPTLIYVDGSIQNGPYVIGRGAAIAALEEFGSATAALPETTPFWWYVGNYETGIALLSKPAASGSTCQVGVPGFTAISDIYNTYGEFWASYNSTGPVSRIVRNPYTGEPVMPDPLTGLLPYDGYTYFDGFAYWGWTTYAGFFSDAARLDYLATIEPPQISSMLSLLAAEVRAFGESIEGLTEGDPPTAASRQFSYSVIYYVYP